VESERSLRLLRRKMASALSSGNGGPSRANTPDATTMQETDLASFFECPVCFDYALPPIYQVSGGFV